MAPEEMNLGGHLGSEIGSYRPTAAGQTVRGSMAGNRVEPSLVAVSQGQQLGLTGHTGPYKTVADLLFPVDVKGGHIIPNAFPGIQCFQLAVVFIVGRVSNGAFQFIASWQ